MTNSQPTSWRSSSSHQSEFGCVLTSPRPNTWDIISARIGRGARAGTPSSSTEAGNFTSIASPRRTTRRGASAARTNENLGRGRLSAVGAAPEQVRLVMTKSSSSHARIFARSWRTCTGRRQLVNECKPRRSRGYVASSCTIMPSLRAKNGYKSISWPNGGRCRD
jgi:hypothetical protein